MTIKFEELPRYEYETKEINLDNHGQKLFAQVMIPLNGAKKHPLVILSHGLGVNHENNKSYYQDLVSIGIAVYIFDFRGGCNNNQSEGKTTDMSVMTEVSDLEAVLKSAQSLDWVDLDKIALFGHSQGGFVTAITAARHADEIHSVMLMAPGFNIPETVRETLKQYEAAGSTDFKWFDMSLGMRFVQDALNYDPYSEAGKFNRNVLLIHGTADKLVHIDYSHKLLNIYKNIEFHEIADAKHNFRGDSYNEAIHHIVDFVQTTGLLEIK